MTSSPPPDPDVPASIIKQMHSPNSKYLRIPSTITNDESMPATSLTDSDVMKDTFLNQPEAMPKAPTTKPPRILLGSASLKLSVPPRHSSASAVHPSNLLTVPPTVHGRRCFSAVCTAPTVQSVDITDRSVLQSDSKFPKLPPTPTFVYPHPNASFTTLPHNMTTASLRAYAAKNTPAAMLSRGDISLRYNAPPRPNVKKVGQKGLDAYEERMRMERGWEILDPAAIVVDEKEEAEEERREEEESIKERGCCVM